MARGTNPRESSDLPDATKSKVGRLIVDYGLEGIGDDLERRWTSEGEDRHSLRELADYFNRDLLEVALRETDLASLDGTLEHVYRVLSDGAEDGTELTRVRRRLERADVDVDRLQSELVSYQAIRTYLRDYRGAEYDPPDTDGIRTTNEHIQKLRTRLQAVTETNVDRLVDAGDIALEEYRTSVAVRVLCESCGTQYTVSELLEEKGCDCLRDENEAA